MDYFNKFYEKFLHIKIFDTGLTDFLLFLITFTFLYLLRNFISNIIIKYLSILIKNKFKYYGIEQVKYLRSPLNLLPIIFSLVIIFPLIKNNENIFFIQNIIKSFCIVFIFWSLHQIIFSFNFYFSNHYKKSSLALNLWIINALRYLVLILMIITILEIWGIKVLPIIAGLGLFGVAIALGAQDLFKNIISGLLIILERTFSIDDVINVPGQVEGTVEYIGFRSTRIRKFDSTPVIIPNYIFSMQPIINYSNRQHRRINLNIGLTYKTTLPQIKTFIEKILNFIKNNDEFIVNDKYSCVVNFDNFSESSLDICIFCFTASVEWQDYLNAKEHLSLYIKKIVDQDGLSFAFPSQSIFLEKE